MPDHGDANCHGALGVQERHRGTGGVGEVDVRVVGELPVAEVVA